MSGWIVDGCEPPRKLLLAGDPILIKHNLLPTLKDDDAVSILGRGLLSSIINVDAINEIRPRYPEYTS